MSEMMPDSHPLTPRQEMLESQIKNVVEVFGLFDQSTGADGAHYVEESPFAAEGMVCSSCAFFEGTNACEVVAGDIKPNAVCKFWIIPQDLMTVSASAKEPTGVKLTMDMQLTAADMKTRTVSGRIVPFGEPGNTSAGKVIFTAGSINIAEPSAIKLFTEHDMTKPVGRAVSLVEGSDGINGEFRIANTTAGTDRLVEAADGLRDGFSVGVFVRESENIDGIMHVTAADLYEVSLVTRPAFASALITDVAASENSDPAPAGTDAPTEGETMTDVMPAETPTVEASEPATVGLAFTTPRIDPNMTAGEYAQHMLKAQRGDNASIAIVTAAVAQDTLAENPGVVPTRYLNQILNNGIIDGRRPLIDRMQKRALPVGGQKFNVPKWTTPPTVATTAEFVQYSSNDTAIDYIEVTKVKAGGVNRVSAELIEFSDPNFLDELVSGLINQYYRATDVAAIAAIKAGAGASGGTGYVASFNDAIGDAGAILRKDPTLALLGSAAWAGVKGAVDSTGRPLYAAINPMNAAGAVVGSGLNIQGLEGFVDYNATSTDILVLSPESATFYENGAPVQIRMQYASDGSVEVSVGGFYGICINSATSVRAVTVV
jgi:HK97 family phage prohead protease